MIFWLPVESFGFVNTALLKDLKALKESSQCVELHGRNLHESTCRVMGT